MRTLQEYCERAGLVYDSTTILFDRINPHAHYKGESGVYAYVRFEGVDCESLDVFIKDNEVLLVNPIDIRFY